MAGCVSVETFPEFIPPLGSAEIPVSFHVRWPRGTEHVTHTFAEELPIYTDSPGTPKLLLKFDVRVEPEPTCADSQSSR